MKNAISFPGLFIGALTAVGVLASRPAFVWLVLVVAAVEMAIVAGRGRGGRLRPRPHAQ